MGARTTQPRWVQVAAILCRSPFSSRYTAAFRGPCSMEMKHE